MKTKYCKDSTLSPRYMLDSCESLFHIYFNATYFVKLLSDVP